MKRVALLSLMTLIMVGCTNKECNPRVEYLKQKFPRLETVEVNTSVEIPSYLIKREKISIVDKNVTMSLKTFKKIKMGDALKVDYLKKRLKLFIYIYKVLNNQVKKYNKEFIDGQRNSD